MIVRPILVEVAAAIGWIAVALATLFGQAIVMQVAMDIVPGASFDSFWTAVAAAWLAAAFVDPARVARQRRHRRVLRGQPAAHQARQDRGP